MPSSSAFAIDSSSRMLPPGWTMAVTPYCAARATVSPKGRKPSEARISPLPKPAACASLRAISAEPTRFIWPAPTPRVWPSRTTAMAFDFTCLTIRQPKSISRSWAAVGLTCVTHISGVIFSTATSSCCTSIPPLTPTYCIGAFPEGVMSTCSTRKFFLDERISRASGVKDGAMTISRKMGFMPCATSAVSSRFTATMPP